MNEYLRAVQSALIYRSPDIGELLSYQDKSHAENYSLFNNISANFLPQLVSQRINHPWDELVTSHLRCVYMIQHERYVDASKEQQNSLQLITRIVQGTKVRANCS